MKKNVKKHYVYMIINRVNRKVYIGKTSRTVEERFKEHLRGARRNSEDKVLYQAIRKYGEENFEVNILEVCDSDEEASRLEMYWIKKFDSIARTKNCKGYNCTKGGDGRLQLSEDDEENIIKYFLKCNHVAQTSEKLGISMTTVSKVLQRNNIFIETSNKKSIYGTHLETGEIINFNSIIDAAKYFKNDEITEEKAYKRISNVLYHEQKTAFNHIWNYSDCQKTIMKKEPIVMTKNAEVLKIFQTHKDAYKYLNLGQNAKNIGKALNKQLITAYGYNWYYAKDFLRFDNKHILQIKNGRIINSFSTIKEAYIALNKNPKSSNISKALIQKNTAYGYEWYYAGDYFFNDLNKEVA